MEPTDKVVTDFNETVTPKKEAIGIEGWLFYLFLIASGIILPIGSYILMLSIA